MTIAANIIRLKLPIYLHMEFLLVIIFTYQGTILIFLSKFNELHCLFTFYLCIVTANMLRYFDAHCASDISEILFLQG